MKRILIASLCYAGTAALGVSGKYQGEGEWRDNLGHSGKYTARVEMTTVETTTFFRTDCKYDDGHADSRYLRARIDSQGFLKAAGVEGYCFAKGCHYTKREGDWLLEETFLVREGTLDKLGSRSRGAEKVTWTEHLTENEAYRP